MKHSKSHKNADGHYTLHTDLFAFDFYFLEVEGKQINDCRRTDNPKT